MPRTPLSYVPRGHRRQLQRQSERAAQRIYGPEIQMYRGQKKRVRRQYRQDIRANQGSIAFTQDAISNVPLKGLHGKDRKMLAEEMALSSRDVASSLPFLNAESRAVKSDAMNTIRQDILTARVARTQDAARRYATELDQAGNRLMQDAKDEATDFADKRKLKRERKGKMKIARRRLMQLLAEAPQSVPWGEKALKKYGSEEDAWLVFERVLAKDITLGEGDEKFALQAVREFRRRGKKFSPQLIPGYQGADAYSMYDRMR